MLTYNTQQKDLALPEYGRNIQRMVDHCLTIEDREERTQCAYTIVKTMSIMSNFKLDIDWPFEVIQPDSIEKTPEPVLYQGGDIARRQYGKIIESMINVAAEMEEGEERDALLSLIANQMKKNLLAIDKDDAPDERIYRDIYDLSGGKININDSSVTLHEFNVIAPAGKKKKKK
jgi:phage baseplate assembly protein W